MDSMIKTGMAGMVTGLRNRFWGLFAVLAVVLLLTVQIGLAVHGSSHLHGAGTTGGCNL